MKGQLISRHISKYVVQYMIDIAKFPILMNRGKAMTVFTVEFTTLCYTTMKKVDKAIWK